VTEAFNFPARVDQADSDAMLRMLGKLASPQVTMSITLVLHGGIAMGELISRDMWLDLWVKEIRAAGQSGQVFADALTTIMSEAGIYLIDDELPDKDQPSRLHLKDARILSGQYNVGPMLLRVRIDAIAAWSLGTSPPTTPNHDPGG
jgi:hypothetical protein